MSKFVLWIFLLWAMNIGGGGWAVEDKVEPPLRLELDLVDGSHVLGIPSIDSVSVQTSYAKIDISLKEIRRIRMDADHEMAALDLENGDKLKGVITVAPIKIKTAVGDIEVGIEHLKELRVVLAGTALPAGEGPLSFGGVNWLPWRTEFEVQGDKLVSLPKARPGFYYLRNGRGATLMSNIGSAAWKDYSIEFEYCMCGVDPSFNRCKLPLDFRGGFIKFHVADAKESWNERGWSMYSLSLDADGVWSLDCSYNFHAGVPGGWGQLFSEGNRNLAEGRGLKFNPTDGNKFRIDVCGTRIQIWVDGEQLIDLRDEKMGERIGDQTLDHGGVGFEWEHECMGWIRNFSARQLHCEKPEK